MTNIPRAGTGKHQFHKRFRTGIQVCATSSAVTRLQDYTHVESKLLQARNQPFRRVAPNILFRTSLSSFIYTLGGMVIPVMCTCSVQMRVKKPHLQKWHLVLVIQRDFCVFWKKLTCEKKCFLVFFTSLSHTHSVVE